ncbi:hypothetical protein D3C72_1522490 [compost metagenome]
MGARIVGVELQGLARRVIGNLAGDGRRPEIVVVVAPDVDGHPRDPRMGIGKPRIEIDRLLVEGERLAIGFDVAVDESLLLGPHVIVVGFEIVGRDARQLVAFAFAELDLQRRDDLADDIVLDGEEIGILPVVALRPERQPAHGIDQLDVDAQPLVGPLQRSLENVVNPQFRRHVLDLRGVVLHREHRVTGNHE